MKLNLYTIVFKNRRLDGTYEFAKQIYNLNDTIEFEPTATPRLIANRDFCNEEEWETTSLTPIGLDKLELIKCTLEIE